MISDNERPEFIVRLEAFCRRLCETSWEDPEGPIRLTDRLDSTDLEKSEFYQNTRLFLLALQEQNGAVATATGNLTRMFVRPMLDRMILSPLRRKTILTVNKVINEMDLWPLHLIRVVTQAGGLIALRKKRFHLTREGARLLSDGCEGKLYRRLFIDYFRKFNLHYAFSLREVPAIQQSMAVILWRLDDVARDWRAVKGLAPQILLPNVLKQLRAKMVLPYDSEEWILSGYVLDPLERFGLLELKRSVSEKWPGVTETDSVRVSPLWKKFVAFVPKDP